MATSFCTNSSETRFINKLRECIDLCSVFRFSVSFIKKPGLKLIAQNIKAALDRGAHGYLITSTYQNFTDIDSLEFFNGLQATYPDQFSCHLDKNCFYDQNGNNVGFHTKGHAPIYTRDCN